MQEFKYPTNLQRIRELAGGSVNPKFRAFVHTFDAAPIDVFVPLLPSPEQINGDGTISLDYTDVGTSDQYHILDIVTPDLTNDYFHVPTNVTSVRCSLCSMGFEATVLVSDTGALFAWAAGYAAQEAMIAEGLQ